MPSVGETLRSAREQRGLSIEQVSHDTRISARFLEALEADRHGDLPAPVYVRGFIRSYASYLKLDGAALLARLSEEGAPVHEPAIGQAPAARDSRRQDPFQRAPTAPFDPGPIVSRGEEEIPPGARQTVRRRAPGRPLPPPPVPPDAIDDLDEEGFRRREPMLLEESESRGISSRTLALVGIGAIGVIVALVTGVLITRGGGGDAVTAEPGGQDPETPRGGSVVVIGSQTPAPQATGTRTVQQPGAPSGGTSTPSAGESETPAPSDSDTPPAADETEDPSDDEEDTPEPTSIPTAVPTPTATIPLPTATPNIPTPTIVPFPHPDEFDECDTTSGGDFPCGPPPLRVICPPDGSWFVDVGKDFLKPPTWRENNTAINTGSARAIGEAGC